MQNSNCQICVKRYILETHPTHPATALAYCPCEKVCRHVHQDWEGRERGFKSQLGFLLAWARSGLYTTLVVSESNNGEVEISWLSLLESFTSTSLKVNWSVIVNNTFRRLLLPRLLGKHKNFATCANNSQKEVLAGQNVKLSNSRKLID